MMTTLSHFSRQPIGALHYVDQDPCPITSKPSGLWVSVDGEEDWPTWCKSEDFDGCGPYHYKIQVDRPGALLWLTTAAEVSEFNEKYGTNPDNMLPLIDWVRVAKDYAGVVITPYQFETRLSLFWYYGWDCASGCIWDPEACDVSVEQLSAPMTQSG